MTEPPAAGTASTAGGAATTAAPGTAGTTRGTTSAGGGAGGGGGTSATTAATATGGGCGVGAQSPPTGSTPANFATALAFAPDGRLFFAERAGTIKVVQNGTVKTFATVPTVTTEPGGGYSERGLLGLAISPSFAADRFVYAFFSNVDRSHQNVVRLTDCGGTGTDPKVILTLPSGGDCCHKGGRLAFGPDGKLYVTLGDERTAAAAQNTGDVRGKLLRYNPDGSVPSDNPFGAGNPVYAYGLRNPFGLAISASGQIAITSNGPSGDAGAPPTGYDELILSVGRGAGYQWPVCYGYSHPIPPATSCGGQPGPDWSTETSTAVPTGATFVDGSGPAGYANHLVFCSYNNGMQIVSPGSPHASVAGGPGGCRFDVKEGPNHALYFADGTTIYRLG